MRSLFLLLLGAFSGAIATVLFFSFDTSFDSDPDTSAGIGNARLVFEEPGLETIIRERLNQIDGLQDVSRVNVAIEEEGVIRVQLGVGKSQVGFTGEVVLDPNVVNGKLDIEVVKAGTGSLDLPEPIADILEQELQESLDSVDPGVDYRLVAITTTNHELTLEVEL
jgi:hypothetical protein